MTQATPPPLPCLVNIPTGRMDEVQEFLESRKIHFNPRECMLVINQGHPERAVFHGEELEEIITEISGYLEADHNIELTIPTGRDWTLEQHRMILELAINEFGWNDELKIRYDSFDGDPSQWAQTAERYPGLFQ